MTWLRDWFRDSSKLAAEQIVGPSVVPAGFRVAGKAVQCPHCHGEQFVATSVNLSSSGAALFSLEWLGPSATALRCAGCGHIALFHKKPERIAVPQAKSDDPR